jgi:hypothetical protein
MFVPQKKQVGCLVATLVLTLGVGNALAIPTLLDGGFEPSATQADMGSGGFVSCADPGNGAVCNVNGNSSWLWWVGPAPTESGNTGIIQGHGILNGSAAEGLQVGMLQRLTAADTAAQAHAQITQDVSGFDAGVPYQLSLQMRDRFIPPTGEEIELTVSLDGAPLSGLTNVPAEMNWQTITSAPFTTTAGTHELKLRIEAGSVRFLFVDDVQLTVVPEPGCLLLAGLAGAFGIGLFRRTGRSG